MNENKDYKKQLDAQDFERIRTIVDAMAVQRRNLGMSQRDLAVRCGMPQSTIARIETYKTTPNLRTFFRMMHYLGMELVVNEQRTEEIRYETMEHNINEETIAAIEEGRRIAKDNSVRTYNTVEELMADLENEL